MASILPGYEYDIFISYRQKDNKHDGWVTEFVNNLTGELESAFKEEISVYFDINPHDGLLETHDISASLKDKLRCLIFIPIISRTYCDPKSFAWESEFCAFNRLAKSDKFGREIKLVNGNVASRILPIKIHDLDEEDASLLENELGGILRAIEFIYKEPGVNRPLKPADNKSENLNKTDYLNQVNKVANAIREIIVSIKNPVDQNTHSKNSDSPTQKKTKKIITPVAIISFILLLMVAGYLIYPGLSPSLKKGAPISKSVAILPFADMSPDSVSRCIHPWVVYGKQEEFIMDICQPERWLTVLLHTSIRH